MKRRRLLQLAPVGGAAASLGLLAQARTPGVDVPPLPGAQRPLSVPMVSERTLSNGLMLLTVQRPGVPLVSASLHLRAGRAGDGSGQAGLAAMAANLLTKGARRAGRAVDASTLARQAEALGSALEVSSGWRVSSLAMTVMTPKLAAALALMADVLRFPLLQAEELERLRAQTLDALKVTLANPGDVAGMAARRVFWGSSVYGGSATPASLQRLKLDDVQRLHQRSARPDRTVLVLAGDIDGDAAARLAAATFGDWARPAEASPAAADAARDTARPAAAMKTLVTMPGSGQSGVVIAAPFAALGDADRRIAEVASALLAGGYSARLNQELRIKRGLSYGAFGGGESHPAGGMFSANAQTQHSTAREVASLMRDEILRVAREEAGEAELAARKATLVGSFARQLETTSGLAAQVASQYFQGRPVTELARYVDEVLAVTPTQVRRFATSVWQPENLRSVIVGDLAAQGDDSVVPIAALDLEQAELKKP